MKKRYNPEKRIHNGTGDKNMKCESCKKEVSKFARACEYCGAPINIEVSQESTYNYEDALPNTLDQPSDEKAMLQSDLEIKFNKESIHSEKKTKEKKSNTYKGKVAFVSLSIILLLSVVGIRYLLTRPVNLGDKLIIYTTSDRLMCYDEKTKSEKVLASGSFENLSLETYYYSDEKVEIENIYYITEDGKNMVYRGNDTVSEVNMGNSNSKAYDLYQIELTSEAKPVLIASNVEKHSILTDEYVMYQSSETFGETYLYNIKTQQRILPDTGMNTYLSENKKYALGGYWGVDGLDVYCFPEMEKIITFGGENVGSVKASPDFSKLLYISSSELHLVSDFESNVVIAENVYDFTVDFSKEEMEVYYIVPEETKTTAYDYIEDNYYEQDITLAKPVLKDGQSEKNPEYVAAIEVYEEKIDRDNTREVLRNLEFDFNSYTLYRYREGEHIKLMDHVGKIGSNQWVDGLTYTFIPYCIGTKNQKMEIDWSKSPTYIYNELWNYYEYELGQRNVYLFGDEKLIDLGEYEVTSIDREEKYLSMATYSMDGEGQSLERMKQVSYQGENLGMELMVQDNLPLDHSLESQKVDGLVITSNILASGIYYRSDDTAIDLEGYIAGSCQMTSEDKTFYYLAEGRNGSTLYQLAEESEEPVQIAEQVVAFQPISKTEVIVLCQEEGSEEGTVYRITDSKIKEEIANNATTLPGYMWE